MSCVIQWNCMLVRSLFNIRSRFDGEEKSYLTRLVFHVTLH